MKLSLAAVLVAAALGMHPPASAQTPAPPTPLPAPSATTSPILAPTPTPATSAAPTAAPLPVPEPSATAAPVLLPAGVVPSSVDIELAGTVTPRFAMARVRAAIDALAQRRPGTLLDIHGITFAGQLAPGSSLDALAGVAIDGRGAYADVNGKTNVHIGVADLGPFEPGVLFYSDDPEYIGPTDDGVLFRASIASTTPARLFLYHVASGSPRRVSLVLQTTATPARVQVVGTAVGPSPQFAYVGQQTTARFLAEHALQEGVLIDLTPDLPYEVPLATLQPGDLIEAIEDLRVVTGGPVTVAVVTAAGPVPLATLLGGPELAGDSHNRRGVYSLLDVPPVDLALGAGAAEPDPVTVGIGTFANERAGGRALGGDYGVARRVLLHVANPSDHAQTVYLFERTEGGGGATVTMLFDGEATPTLVPCVNDSVQPRLVRAFELAPGAAQTIGATYMTDGASSYPIEFGLTVTPPLPVPPGACNGPPSPAPAPAPTASGG